MNCRWSPPFAGCNMHSVYRVAIPEDVDPRPSPLGEYDEVRWVEFSDLPCMW